MPRRRKQTQFGAMFLESRTPERNIRTKPNPSEPILWASLRQKIVSALEPYPEAREALVDSLASELGLLPETRIQL